MSCHTCGSCTCSKCVSKQNDGRCVKNYDRAMMHLDALLYLLRREGYDPSIPAIADARAFVAEMASDREEVIDPLRPPQN